MLSSLFWNDSTGDDSGNTRASKDKNIEFNISLEDRALFVKRHVRGKHGEIQRKRPLRSELCFVKSSDGELYLEHRNLYTCELWSNPEYGAYGHGDYCAVIADEEAPRRRKEYWEKPFFFGEFQGAAHVTGGGDAGQKLRVTGRISIKRRDRPSAHDSRRFEGNEGMFGLVCEFWLRYPIVDESQSASSASSSGFNFSFPSISNDFPSLSGNSGTEYTDVSLSAQEANRRGREEMQALLTETKFFSFN